MAETAGQGLKTAVDLVMEALPGAGPNEPEQIDIEDVLGLPRAPEMPVLATGEAARRPGRPPGARNKRTTEWANYLLSRYSSPLEVLAQIACARVEDLKLSLDCSALEAFQEKRHAAVALAPFLHQRQPLALNISERKLVYLTIQQDSGPSAAGDDGAITIEAKVVKDQGLSDAKPSHVDQSHVDQSGQALDPQGLKPIANGHGA